MSGAWQPRKKHERALRDALAAEGFEVVGARRGRHLRLRVRRGEREATLTWGCSPSVPDEALENAIKQARRAVAP